MARVGAAAQGENEMQSHLNYSFFAEYMLMLHVFEEVQRK